MNKYIFTLGIVALLFSCQKDNRDSELDSQLTEALEIASEDKGLDFFILPESDDYANIPQDPKNPITNEKVNLGKLLFHESAISGNVKLDVSKGTVSCASCHFAEAGFQAGTFQSMGDGSIGFAEARQPGPLATISDLDAPPVKSPTAMNGAYQKNMLWNGSLGATGTNVGTENLWLPNTNMEQNLLGYEGLETQVLVAMNAHRFDISQDWVETFGYKSLFDIAFPDIPENERYSTETVAQAIGAYERTILANKAPFQLWLKGDKNAMSQKEKEGAILYFGKAECAACHTGPALSSMEYYSYGFSDLYECPERVFNTPADHDAHKGRGGFTGVAEDMFKFKVPQMYNLEDSPFLGHGSSFRSIKEIVQYKNEGKAQNTRIPTTQLAEEFVALDLSEDEVDALTLFITRALRDPDLLRYQPYSVKSGNCIPNNDPMSKNQLGCD